MTGYRSIVSGVLFGLAALTVERADATQQVFKSQTDVVAIYASVVTSDGRYVSDLDRSHFEAFDNGRKTPIAVFSSEVQTLSVALVVDRSSSNMAQTPWATTGLQAFVAAMRVGDQASLATLGTDLVPMTPDSERLRAAIARGLPRDTSSPVWAAALQAIRAVATQPQRRIVFLLSDGLDSGSGPPPAEIIRESERHLVTLYAADYTRPMDLRRAQSSWQEQLDRSRDQLRTLLQHTGGDLYLLREGTGTVEDSFTSIAEGFRNQYLLGIEPAARDGKVHRVEIKVKHRDATVRTRRTYLAAPGSPRREPAEWLIDPRRSERP